MTPKKLELRVVKTSAKQLKLKWTVPKLPGQNESDLERNCILGPKIQFETRLWIKRVEKDGGVGDGRRTKIGEFGYVAYETTLAIPTTRYSVVAEPGSL